MHDAKNYCLGYGVAPQAPIPQYPIGQQKCLWIPMMSVFEMHNAKKYVLGSTVAPQTPIPRYPGGQQKCFWIPRMVVSEMRNAKKYCLGLLGGAPNTHDTVPYRPGKLSLDIYDGGFETKQLKKKKCLRSGPPPRTPIPLYPIG